MFCLNENEDCPFNYPLLIKNTNKCVDKCTSKNIILFNKICYEHCPENSIQIENKNECKCIKNYYIENEKNICLKINEKCPDNYSYLLIETNECLKNCPINYLTFNNTCIKNCTNNYYEFNGTCVNKCPNNYYKSNKNKCEESKNIVNDIDSNILLIHEEDHETFEGDDFKAEIYDSNNVIENDNISSLNLGECENKLKEYYNISMDESLIIYKMDFYPENSFVPIIQYKIYNKKGDLLNLSVCENITIDISTPVNLSKTNIDISKLNETINSGIDIFNISSDFFNDICNTFSSSNGTDVPIKDRKKDYFQDISFCEEGCVYGGFNGTNNKVVCNCNVKQNSNNEKINNKEIKNSFTKILSNSNLKVLKCIYLYGIPIKFFKNYGSYIFIFCEISEIILLIYTFYIGYYPLMKFIKLIDINIYYKNNNNNQIKNINNPPKKLNNFNKENNESNFYNMINVDSTNRINLEQNKEYDNFKLNNIIIYNKISVFNKETNNKYITNKEKSKHINKIYNNEEINDLNYNESLLIDNRNFIQIYYSFLEYSQLIIFTFITRTDFNLRSIKISLFLFSCIIYLTFNTLFFTDDTMSHIYNKGGSFDFLYNLPKTLFSGVCCGIVNFLLKFLSLSQKDIKLLNNIKNINYKNIKIGKIIKCWKIKLIIFYILIFGFMALFHLYVGTFCSVYVNTQKHLIKSTLISFFLSMIYPFGICLVTATFRKLSLYYKNKYLFFVSKILSLF